MSAPLPSATQGEVCAHLRIRWCTTTNDHGQTTGWWECETRCGARFVHEAALRQRELDIWAHAEQMAVTASRVRGRRQARNGDDRRLAVGRELADAFHAKRLQLLVDQQAAR